MNDLDLKRPAIIGGLIVGLGSVIPVISVINCCFCAWALIGGVVASKVLVDSSPRPLLSADGARVGVVAGLVGGGIYFFGTLLLSLTGTLGNAMLNIMEWLAASTENPELQEQLRRVIEQAATQTAAQRLISAIPVAIVFAIFLIGFATLGGVLGVKLFEKRSGQVPPPPPQYPPQYPPQTPPPGGGWPQGGA